MTLLGLPGMSAFPPLASSLCRTMAMKDRNRSVRTPSAIMLTYHLRDTGGALATLDFDGDFVGDAQRIRWHVLRRHYLYSATQPRTGGDRSEIPNSVGSVVQRVFHDFQPDDIPNERRDKREREQSM